MDPAQRRTEAERRSEARQAAAAGPAERRRTEAERRSEAREAEGEAQGEAGEDGPATSRRPPSLVLVNTGHGKGKSSAAFGVMGRGWARGWRVGVVQFVKGGKWKTGERKLADHLGIEWHTLGDGFTWESTDLDETAAKGRHAWDVARQKLASGDYDLLILDELTYAVTYGWVPVADVVEGLHDRAPRTNVVITGRDAPPEVIELADTVTEMRKVKHAYDHGITAKKGIEY
ncbi:MAG TPA: cob(I)yrinic acid a,c-diamide adenosyltransferase [Acidimicrobiales bacterium]|nr:cob(I)yrinic acid a,c-diamide adenosyltransferase [Acidimicrobiales bacterium]